MNKVLATTAAAAAVFAAACTNVSAATVQYVYRAGARRLDSER